MNELLMSSIADLSKAKKFLENARRQVLYAEAQACNRTAIDIQQSTVNKLLPDKFTLRARGNPWQRPGTAMGFNVKFANVNKPESVVGSRADWLKLQEEGGQKKVSGHRLAIPTPFWKMRDEIMRREKKPRQILDGNDKQKSVYDRALSAVDRVNSRLERLAGRYGDAYAREARLRSKDNRKAAARARQTKIGVRLQIRRAESTRGKALTRLNAAKAAGGSLANKPFEAKMPNGTEGIFVRVGRERGKFRMLFKFQADAPIKPILGFVDSGTAIAKANYEKNFTVEFAKALATSKA